MSKDIYRLNKIGWVVVLALAASFSCKQKIKMLGFEGKCVPPAVNRVAYSSNIPPFTTTCSITKGFDAKGRIVTLDESNPAENNLNYFYTKQNMYDSFGHIVYERYTLGFPARRIECYNYYYNRQGELISKEGFDSAKAFFYVDTLYENGKVVKTLKEKI